MKSKRILIVISSILIAVIAITLLSKNETKLIPKLEQLDDSDFVELEVNKIKLKLEVASSNSKQQKGLMNINEPLEENSGMIFIYSKPDNRSFWMLNTFISLDIIFLDSNLKVLNIHKNTKTNQTTEVYNSKGEAQYVIELNAGSAEKFGIEEGSVFKP